jgi:hypothetical protein
MPLVILILPLLLALPGFALPPDAIEYGASGEITSPRSEGDEGGKEEGPTEPIGKVPPEPIKPPVPEKTPTQGTIIQPPSVTPVPVAPEPVSFVPSGDSQAGTGKKLIEQISSLISKIIISPLQSVYRILTGSATDQEKLAQVQEVIEQTPPSPITQKKRNSCKRHTIDHTSYRSTKPLATA